MLQKNQTEMEITQTFNHVGCCFKEFNLELN